jgi:hypothetical protein
MLRPQAFSQFLTRYNFARAFEEHAQDLERLLLDFDAGTALEQFAPGEVHFKYGEPDVQRLRL